MIITSYFKPQNLPRLLLFGVIWLTGCVDKPKTNEAETSMKESRTSIEKVPFGTTRDGQSVVQYTLANEAGMVIKVINYGGIITSIMAPDNEGTLEDIVLGFDNIADYEDHSPYFGAIIGRYGNRIAKGEFSMDGVSYTLATNKGENHLHGGNQGFDKVIWDVKPLENQAFPGLELTYTSEDGEEGYPGNLSVKVTYLLTDKNELQIKYEAETDRATPVNLTNHTYFNLSGNDERILSHELSINADRYTVVNASLIPTGELRPVPGTPMDFRNPTPIGARIAAVEGGYDHNYVLRKEDRKEPSLAATVHEPGSGRVMEVYTTEPGIQFYSGNFLDGTFEGKKANRYDKHDGFCLETQHFPDSPNHPEFPTTILNPGEKLESATTYKFSVRR